MATTAEEVIAQARVDLQDVDGVHWPDPDMLGYLNDGQTVISMLKPVSSQITAKMPLQEGCEQNIPGAGIMLIRVNCNVAGSGAIGSAPRMQSIDVIDMMLPDWRTHAANKQVKMVLFNSSTPKLFWVYPQQPPSTDQKLEIIYAAVPAKVAGMDGNISLTDEYVPALIDYVLYRAFAKDSEIAAAASRSQQALSTMAAKLGLSVPQVRRATQQQENGQ